MVTQMGFISAVGLRLVFQSKLRRAVVINPPSRPLIGFFDRHVRVRKSQLPRSFLEVGKSPHHPSSYMYASTSTNSDHLMAQVIGLVKKYDRVDASKVSETADFQKDLCLDSLDMVELVMALEQEFSTEIPEDKADKLTCCADVVNYLLTESNYPTAKSL